MIHMRVLAFGLAMLMVPCAWGQEMLHGVWVLNEGNASSDVVVEPVTLGRFDPVALEYEVIAEVPGAAFATDVLVSDLGVFISTAQGVMRFDRDSGELLASLELEGARQLALHEGNLFVTRGEFDAVNWEPVAFDAYLVWLDAVTLAWQGELSTEAGPQFACEGVVSVGEDVFVAVGNAFDFGNEVGVIGRFSPNSGSYEEFDLGPEGKNPVHLLERNGVLYAVNNGDWSATSLSRLDVASGDVLTTVVDASASGCMAASLVGDKLAFQVSGESEVRTALLEDLSPAMPLLATSIGFYAMEEDPLSGQIYASETDWFSYGQVHIFAPDGAELASFNAGISPVAMAMDIRSVNHIAGPEARLSSKVTRSWDVTGRELTGGGQAAGVVIEGMEDGSTRKRMAVPLRD